MKALRVLMPLLLYTNFIFAQDFINKSWKVYSLEQNIDTKNIFPIPVGGGYEIMFSKSADFTFLQIVFENLPFSTHNMIKKKDGSYQIEKGAREYLLKIARSDEEFLHFTLSKLPDTDAINQYYCISSSKFNSLSPKVRNQLSDNVAQEHIVQGLFDDFSTNEVVELPAKSFEKPKSEAQNASGIYQLKTDNSSSSLYVALLEAQDSYKLYYLDEFNGTTWQKAYLQGEISRSKNEYKSCIWYHSNHISDTQVSAYLEAGKLNLFPEDSYMVYHFQKIE